MIARPSPRTATLDANEAVAGVAYRMSELFAIYPITPSSPMGEWVDEWSYQGRRNLWNHVPEVIEMQSEGGAAGTLHGALQAGALASSFTASQGLLLMIPNLYKIVGELHPFVLHVTARSVATHALSIFCDHGDVMACRQTGAAILCASSVQEAQDFAAIAHAATLRTRVPFLHFFDGFRTSHEVQKIALLADDDLRRLLPAGGIKAFRGRALTPDRPAIRGTAQNPDVFFQAREAANRFHDAVPGRVQELFDSFAGRTGRAYRLFDYEGAADADRVIILMGSGAETAAETSAWLNAQGGRTGVVKVRLFRPLDAPALLAALPASTRRIAVLDRTKEPGSLGEPLFLDVAASLLGSDRADHVTLCGGRYGLGSKEFTPAMAKAVFDDLAAPTPRRRFTLGITDDVTHLSLPFDPSFDLEQDHTRRAVFYGLGADGTVGANKNSIKIIGEGTDLHAQGFFVYDSKKSGAMTISHLRFGPEAIRAPYLIQRADFIAVHHFPFIERMDVLSRARPGAILLLNVASPPEQVWDRLPREAQARIVELGLQVHAIDAYRVAGVVGLVGQINTVMQTCFFALSGVLPRGQAIAAIKQAITKTYGRKGEAVVARNQSAVDAAVAELHAVAVPSAVTATVGRPALVPAHAPDFVQRVTALMLADRGDDLPVSALPVDGTWPTATARWEKRGVATQIPVWDPALCIQCNKCVLVCPHAAIRCAAFPTAAQEGAPPSLKRAKLKGPEAPDHLYSLQVAPEDCTGCTLCQRVCPARDKSDLKRKALAMAPVGPLLEQERANFDFFLRLPTAPAALLQDTVKGSQFRAPLFEFSGACAGCGETPYLKLLTQLFGDRLILANATGCSSIYGGNLPTTPYAANREGRGPAWSNSLFEDNAEYGLGLRAGIDQLASQARGLLAELSTDLPAGLETAISKAEQGTDAGLATARAAVSELKDELRRRAEDERAQRLLELADYLVAKSVWIVGGDGWAYDIGFGGLDHVLASGRKVNLLVLDTEVYSNTGGQRSKATPLGAVAKFSAAGKDTDKKDLALLAAQYEGVYVARVAFGAKDGQTVQALLEAERHPGPALILAYAPCIAHGYSLANGLEQQRLAVETGSWPLFRHDPARAARGQPVDRLDSAPPRQPLSAYTRGELRFQALFQSDPDRAALLAQRAQQAVDRRFAAYQRQAAHQPPVPAEAKCPEGRGGP